MAVFTGAGVAIVTPFKENGEVNYEKFGELIEDQIAGGTDAIIVCFSTSTLSAAMPMQFSRITHSDKEATIKAERRLLRPKLDHAKRNRLAPAVLFFIVFLPAAAST